ncbi:hypothetical protein Trydic_g19528 [Trypoxylus dichotomus]
MSEMNSSCKEDASATSVQVLFTMSRKSTSEIDTDKSKENGDDASTVCAEIDSNSIETGGLPDTILCVFWNSGKIGGAYLNIVTQQSIG